MENEAANCAQCQSPSQGECPDCHQALCRDHSCSLCSRCEQDCLCQYRWWLPELF